jgi:acetyl esterase/lipase
MVTKTSLLHLLLLLISFKTMAQLTIPLYEGTIPGNLDNLQLTESTNPIKVGTSEATFTVNVTVPQMTIYLPQKSSGIGVIICPGGGYSGVAMDHEGHAIAKRFNEAGIAAFVLKYRTPLSIYQYDKTFVPLQDAQRALQLVRQNAKLWQLKPNKIGMLGSSAGGHLAASAGTMHGKNYIGNEVKIDLRPSFLVLNYPVITFTDAYTHKGSRLNLIGKSDGQENDAMDKKSMELFSCELNVDAHTPPTFITHAIDDDAVPVQNSLLFIAALQQHNVKVSSFFYTHGGHGYGMDNETADRDWMPEAITFIKHLYKK